MSATTYSEQHPHEPQIAPVLDADGRCLICLISHADQLVSRLHDLMYDVPLPEQATETHRSTASNAVWEIHEVLRRPLAAREEGDGAPVSGVPSWHDDLACPDCGELNCYCDDDRDELECTHCGGDGICDDGADPLWSCPPEAHFCHACRGSGRRRDQVIW